MDDVLTVIGLALIVAGIAMLNIPAGVIAAGVVLVVIGLSFGSDGHDDTE